MHILGIHHVFVPCTALEQTRAFYVDVLGLSVDPSGPRTADPGPGAWLDVGSGQQVHMKENATEWHVSFEVVDLADAIETLTAHGIEVSAPSINPSIGVRQSAFRDPSGMLLEVFERLG
jgi:glyoxylase I family protein